MGKAFFRKLQVKLNDWGIERLKSYSTIYMKTLFIICYYVARCEGDAYIIVCGDNNTGKSNFSIKSGIRVAKMLREEFGIETNFSIKKNVFFTPTKDDINQLQQDKRYQVLVFDEGYFLGMNLDFNIELAKETTRVAMGTRSKHNVIFFNFQRPTRATKTLLERFKVMFIKLTKPDSILMCRSTMSILSKDAWGLEPILKEENDTLKARMIKHNQNYVTGLQTKKLNKRLDQRFQKLQTEALKKRGEGKNLQSEIRNEYIGMAQKILKLEEKTELNTPTEIKQYLLRSTQDGGPGYNEENVKSFMRFYNKWTTKERSKIYLQKEKREEIESEEEDI